MGLKNSKLVGTTMKIHFEGDSRAFDSDNPIEGVINIQSNVVIPAYGIQLKLELVEKTRVEEITDESYSSKNQVWERSEMIEFENIMCPAGNTNIPFSFKIPESAHLP